MWRAAVETVTTLYGATRWPCPSAPELLQEENSTSYVLGVTCLIGGAAAGGGGGGGAAASMRCVLLEEFCWAVASSDMIDVGGVEFDESVIDNSDNLLVDWRVIQYNAACNFICYHNAGIAFWLFSSSRIVADKMGDLCRAGCVQNYKFVINFVTIWSGQKDPE